MTQQSSPGMNLAAATYAPVEQEDHVHDHDHDHDHEHDHDELETIPLSSRIANFIGITVPFAGFVVAVVLLWGSGFGWLETGLLLGMYLFTAVGVTVGFHRLFTHRAFKTNRVVQAILAVGGSMALEGPILRWAANHRCHHQHSDRPGDPHSPHEHGHGVWGVIKGIWHAHMGWIVTAGPVSYRKYVPDLASDKFLTWLSKYWLVWAALGLVIPAVIGGLITMSWTGAFLGFLWGGLVRIFLVHHVTWSVNSVCHIWGYRSFKSSDHSRNNAIFGILAMGEGWHNNHHAFPTSARHGLKWWEFDASYLLIRLMSKVGLAWDVKVPDAKRLAMKQQDPRTH